MVIFEDSVPKEGQKKYLFSLAAHLKKRNITRKISVIHGAKVFLLNLIQLGAHHQI